MSASESGGAMRNGAGPVSASNPMHARIADGANLDAFSRLRVGIPQLRLSCIFDTSKRSLFWAESPTAGGTATHAPNERSVDMTVTASGDAMVRQTKEYFTYRAGQSQLIFATFCMGDDANVRQRVGYFDAQNGIFLENDGGAASIVRRSYTTGAAVDTAIAQSAWNIDKLDGTGASGITLDLTKTHILVIDLQWLGVGRVRVGFDIDGAIVYVHQFLHANNLTTVYMTTPKLPVRYEIEATGTPSAATTLKQICATVIREGGDEDPSVQHEARSGKQAAGNITVGADWTTVLGVRLKSADIRTTLRLLSATIWNLDTNMVEFAVVLNPSYTGTPTWAGADSDSAAEYARFSAAISIGADGEPDVGHVYPIGGYVSGGSNQTEAAPITGRIGETVPCAADIAGTSDQLWLCARAYDGSAAVKGVMSWTEER